MQQFYLILWEHKPILHDSSSERYINISQYVISLVTTSDNKRIMDKMG